ncbi:DUF397 domain-containing protein [Streptomyces mobaraensis NBRC 13819 = DSM 40847]|uniref:Uncharacterized protein n=1 Tax=Streptomyces mobaraensis (strain ATCC 29032 / DSM 40847 / JCM 4168 / NBRC 13819 / NCIMB 11159 / IPCR 16-22) TaxID=1223523 RepID=M3BHP7_STRM1|nr:DUF397 domain-containing protein [Streptomyces mobaraensis]EME99109.1 hypothetical protein H340_18029 [Streptomyces mobaraensis NBRC 13819 = DSM 40847]QTT76183.1 DUF397 domain-containing protein [Streptomyces mobaraensis NBRC 13819 = DSM 40847]
MGTTSDIRTTEWRTSSYTNGDGGNCVEVADQVPGAIRVRDSKAPERALIRFPRVSWAAFVNAVGETIP